MTITTEADFNALSIEGAGFGQAGRTIKFLVDARDPKNKKVHFVDGNFKVNGVQPDYAKYHYPFARAQLTITESNDAFNEATYFTNAKRFYAGTIQTYSPKAGQPPIYAVQFIRTTSFMTRVLSTSSKRLSWRLQSPRRAWRSSPPVRSKPSPLSCRRSRHLATKR
jgi:hypothetical protein